MSAKKLGRFAAGLFVALGLAFGGLVGGSSAAAATSAPSAGAMAAQFEYDWS
ncbi:hypothetical protein [Actinoplanes sp. NPDC026623]|jgi:hypothetical protein|uniref:hypothetical protein n=1 Tax=Actinoplanes sp. NPDC026623 TaxID=3155610 RepID=UPI0033CD0D51